MWQECVIEVGKEMGLEKVRDMKYKRRDRRLCIFGIHSPLVTGSWVPPLPAVSNTCACQHGVDVIFPLQEKLWCAAAMRAPLAHSGHCLWGFYFRATCMVCLFLWQILIKSEKITKKPIERTLLRLLVQIFKSWAISEFRFEMKL